MADSHKSVEKPTIKKVAELAGVSIGTVSRVINNREGIKSYTKERVLKAMKELNYYPDFTSRIHSASFSSTIGYNIGVGINRFTPFFYILLEKLSHTFMEQGFRFQEVLNGPDGLPSSITDAMLLIGPHDDDLRVSFLQKNHIPFVLLGHGKEISWVMSDDFDGGYQAGKHLIRLGHNRIVHISSFGYQGFQYRYSGFKKALEEEGLEHSQELLVDAKFTSLNTYRIMNQFLDKENDFSAIFAASDEMALGAIAALEDRGLQVPLDISVVGYDDMPMIRGYLTTIRQDIDALAKTCVELIHNEISGKTVESTIIPVQLVARRTTVRNSRSSDLHKY